MRPLADGSGIDTVGVKFDINPFDEIAVEEAVRQREVNPLITITVVTIGGTECEEQLRKALAMGADDAILVLAEGELDSPVVAAELAALVAELKPDVILMGKQATDDDCNQVGQMLAATLAWPQATFAAKVVLAEGSATVTRETDDGEEVLQVPLPAVITVDLRLNEPRYIALPGIIKARSKPLQTRPRATDAQPKTRVISFVAPPARAAGIRVSSVEELFAQLKTQGVL